jgi:hypothetical protein
MGKIIVKNSLFIFAQNVALFQLWPALGTVGARAV